MATYLNNEDKKMNKIIALNLTKIRIMRGLSVSDLAHLMGLCHYQITKYEKAINSISSAKLFRFAEILQVPVSYFYKGEQFDGKKYSLGRLRLFQYLDKINNPTIEKALVDFTERLALEIKT